MALSRQQKEKTLQNLGDVLKKAKSLVLIDYYGLKVKEINQLRQILKNSGCQYLVAKKTFLKKALDKVGLKNIDIDKILGGIGLILGLNDEITSAKLTVQFAKEHEKTKIHGGIFDQKFIDSDAVRALAKLPTKDQMRAQIVWIIKSPLAGLVNVFQGNLRQLVYTLSQIKK